MKDLYRLNRRMLTIVAAGLMTLPLVANAAETQITAVATAVAEAWPRADRATAEAGLSHTNLMTPLRTAQAIGFQAPMFQPDRLWRTMQRLAMERQWRLPVQLRCVAIGDSWSIWPENEMYGAFGMLGLMGDHFPHFNWTNGAALKQGQFQDSMNGRIFEVPAGGLLTFGWASGDRPVLGSQIKVYYLKEPGAGSFALQTERNLSGVWTNEEGAAEVSAKGEGPRTTGILTVRKPQSDYYRVRIVGLAGRVKILHVGVLEQFTGNSVRGGAACLGLAEGGSTPNQWLQPDPEMLKPMLRDWNPQIYFIRGAESLQDWQKCLDPLIRRLRDATPNADFVVIGSHPAPQNRDRTRDNGGCDAFLKSYCATNEILFVDCRPLFPDFTTMVQVGLARGSNDVHLSGAADAYLAGIVWQHLRPLWGPFTRDYKAWYRNPADGWMTDQIQGCWSSVHGEGPRWSMAGDLQNGDGTLSFVNVSRSSDQPGGVAGLSVPRQWARNNGHALALRSAGGVGAQLMADGRFWVAPFGHSAPYSPGRLPSAQLEVTSGEAGRVPLVAGGVAGQQAPLLELRTGVSTAAAGSTVASVDKDGNVSALNLKRGKGSPDGVVAGQVGDLYLRLDGGPGATLYVKESGTGSTGWAAK